MSRKLMASMLAAGVAAEPAAAALELAAAPPVPDSAAKLPADVVGCAVAALMRARRSSVLPFAATPILLASACTDGSASSGRQSLPDQYAAAARSRNMHSMTIT